MLTSSDVRHYPDSNFDDWPGFRNFIRYHIIHEVNIEKVRTYIRKRGQGSRLECDLMWTTWREQNIDEVHVFCRKLQKHLEILTLLSSSHIILKASSHVYIKCSSFCHHNLHDKSHNSLYKLFRSTEEKHFWKSKPYFIKVQAVWVRALYKDFTGKSIKLWDILEDKINCM